MRVFLFIFLISTYSFSAIIDDYMNNLQKEVLIKNPNFKGFDIKRGEEIFTSKHIGKRGKEISCVSCHTNDFSQNGENIFTGKVIKPLSNKTNPKRLTDVKTINKWLKRNFNDVYKKEGTAQEKGDVLKYIISKG